MSFVANLMISLPTKIAIFSLLSLLTLTAHLTVQRYHEVGDQLLQNNIFTEGLSSWDLKASETGIVDVDKGQVHLHSSDAGGAIYLSQSIKKVLPGERLGLKARIRTENIVAGPNGWQRGRVLLLQYQQGKSQYSVSHVLASLEGTNNWTEYRANFPIQPEASDVRVILQLSRCTGELYCRDMSLFKLEKNPVFGVVQWSIMGGWFCFSMFLFGPVLSWACQGWWKSALIVFTILSIIVGTTLPGALKTALKDDLIQGTKSSVKGLSGVDVVTSAKDMARKFSIPEKTLKATLDITKFAHFGLFGMLTFLLLWQGLQPKPLFILTDVLMLACATEFLQLFVEGRGALPLDVVIDMAGSVTGLLIWKKLNRGRRNPGRTSFTDFKKRQSHF